MAEIDLSLPRIRVLKIIATDFLNALTGAQDASLFDAIQHLTLNGTVLSSYNSLRLLHPYLRP